jgi:hypothetical protein
MRNILFLTPEPPSTSALPLYHALCGSLSPPESLGISPSHLSRQGSLC